MLLDAVSSSGLRNPSKYRDLSKILLPNRSVKSVPVATPLIRVIVGVEVTLDDVESVSIVLSS